MTSIPVVFIADDQPDDQYLSRQVFGEACSSAVLYFFGHKSELLKALEHQFYPRPSLLIMDWDMTIRQGYAVLMSLSQTPVWQTIPVVIMTTPDRPVDDGKCQQIGYDLVIAKEIPYEKRFAQLAGLLQALV